jgi:hypothetical protein
MTTQVLIRPLSVMMGDNNNDNNTSSSSSTNLPVEKSPLFLTGISEYGGEAGTAVVVPLSTNVALGKTIAVAERPDTSFGSSSLSTMPAATGTVDDDKVDGTDTSATKVDVTVYASSSSGPSAASYCPTTTASQGGTGRETDIVSHLRRSSSNGSSRQDFETVLKAMGSTEESLHIFGYNAVANPVAASMSSIPMIHPSGFGLNSGNNVNSNNMAALAAAAAGNPLATLLINQMAAGISNSISNNTNNNGVIMLNPQLLMAAGFGMGNFGNLGNLPAAAGGKPRSALDPRLEALFGGCSAAAATISTTPQTTKHKPLTLYMDCDTESLSEYQCLIRQQIELFEADKSEAASSVQGRNKQIVEGQVGIRCRHCAAVPPRQRQKGSMYFPTKLDRIYQAAQNLSTFHLCDNCMHVPENVRQRILLLRERKSPAGGGKRYWGEGVRCLGVGEVQNGLRFL